MRVQKASFELRAFMQELPEAWSVRTKYQFWQLWESLTQTPEKYSVQGFGRGALLDFMHHALH